MNIKHNNRLTAASALILIAAVTCISYWPGLHGPFVFDDISNIVEVPALRITSLDLRSLWDAAFWQKESATGRPVAMLSFALNYYFSQFDSFAFKLTNLVIHLVNGLLLFWLCRRLLRHIQLPATNETAAASRVYWLSLAITGIWLVHPLNLTSVLYIVQRMTSLSALFVLLGLAGYIMGREQLNRGKTHGLATIVASLLVFGTLATLTKENGVLLPLYMLVVEIWVFRFAGSSQTRKLLRWFWVVVIAIPLITAIAILAIHPAKLLGYFSYQYRDFDLSQRLFSEARVIWFYLRLILVPDISIMGIYHDDFITSRGLLDPPTTFLAIAGIASVLVIAVMSYRKAPVLSFAIAWFFAGHSMESTIIPLELVHEHRNYLPQFGILTALVYYILHPHPGLSRSLLLRRVLIGIYLALLCVATSARATDWRDEWTLYNRDVINHPGSVRAHTMLGIILHDNKQYPAAEREFRLAARLGTSDAASMVRLAQHFYGAHGTIPEYVYAELEKRLLTQPYSGLTLSDLAILLNDTLDNLPLNLRLIGLYEKLIARDDIVLSPGWREFAWRTLAFTYRERKDYHNALNYFDKAIAYDPHPAYYLSKGEIYMKLNRPGDAAGMLREIERQGRPLKGDEQLRANNLAAALDSGKQKNRSK